MAKADWKLVRHFDRSNPNSTKIRNQESRRIFNGHY